MVSSDLRGGQTRSTTEPEARYYHPPFEYRIADLAWTQAADHSVLEAQLCAFGADGWELISITEIENFNSSVMGQIFRTFWKRKK